MQVKENPYKTNALINSKKYVYSNNLATIQIKSTNSIKMHTQTATQFVMQYFAKQNIANIFH